MTATHRIFRRPQTVREYGFMDGVAVEEIRSPSGFVLPWEAIDDQATAIADKRSPMYVVIGEFERAGIRYPELAVTTAYIEANTNYRYDRDTKTLRLLCPACGLRDGKHAKGCEA